MDRAAQHAILQHFAAVVDRHEEAAERTEGDLGGVIVIAMTVVAAQKDLADAFEAEPSPSVGLTEVAAAYIADT